MLTKKWKGGEQEYLRKLQSENSQPQFKSSGGCIPFYAITALTKMHLLLSVPAVKADRSKQIHLETPLLQFSRAIHRQMEALILIPSPLCSHLEPVRNSEDRGVAID